MCVVINKTTYDVHAIMFQTFYHVFRLACEIYDLTFGINVYVRLCVKVHL